MIKVCSLDFAHKETFETDIMTAEGGLLCAANEKVTPDKILKLYFKEIYVKEPASSEIPKQIIKEKVSQEVIPPIKEIDIQDEIKEEVSMPQSMDLSEEEAPSAEPPTIPEIPEASEPEPQQPQLSSNVLADEKEEVLAAQTKMQETAQEDETPAPAEISQPTEIKEPEKETEIPNAVVSSSDQDTQKDLTTAPTLKDTSEEKESATSTKGSMTSAENVTHTKEDDSTKGPRTIDTAFVPPEEDSSKGPVAANLTDKYSRDDDTNNDSKYSSRSHAFDEKPAEEPKPVVDENPQLIFDETQAKRIANRSIKLGKMFNYTPAELKELEQVAYYCNYGITAFRKNDLQKREFRKLKILSSYKMLTENGKVPENIAQIIKSCAKNYESDSFPLNSKIPYYHIVAITSSYEDFLAQFESKELTLMKMLQMGGNHFNIFVLHRFIKLMRDSND